MVSNAAVIFDMDGVIVDSNPYHKIALKQFASQHGYELTEELLREKIYGRTNKEWLTNLFGTLPPEKLNQYEEEKEQLYRGLFKKDIKAVAGLPGFLRRLEESGIPLAIGTSAPPSNVTFTLESTGLSRYFSVILDENSIVHSKPDPEIYLKVVAALKLPADRCIVIEDSLSGIAAGRGAGCKVVGITTTHAANEMEDTDFVIDNFEGLDPVFLFDKCKIR